MADSTTLFEHASGSCTHAALLKAPSTMEGALGFVALDGGNKSQGIFHGELVDNPTHNQESIKRSGAPHQLTLG
jgi:exopolysaccharide biosynthesis protein